MAKLVVEIEVFTHQAESDWDVHCSCCHDQIEAGKNYHRAVMMVNREKFREIKVILCDYCKEQFGW